MEAADTSVADMRRDQYEFERDVIKGTGPSKVLTTERVVRFFDDRIKGKVIGY